MYSIRLPLTWHPFEPSSTTVTFNWVSGTFAVKQVSRVTAGSSKAQKEEKKGNTTNKKPSPYKLITAK